LERGETTDDDDVNTYRSMIKKHSDWRLIVLLFLFFVVVVLDLDKR